MPRQSVTSDLMSLAARYNRFTLSLLGPCRVPGYPGTRPINRVPGSVLPVLLPESEIL